MKQVLFVKNVCRETPGLFETIAIERGIPHKTVHLDRGEHIPDPDDSVGALVVMGGPDSVNDDTAKMRHELEQVQKYLEQCIPYYGVCLGMQVLGKLRGEHVEQNPVPEIGFRNPEDEIFTVRCNRPEHPLFRGLPKSFRVFQLHGEAVSVTDKCDLLATGKYCRAQVIGAGRNAYGVQFHTEIIPELFRAWLEEDPDLKKLDRTRLEQDYAKYWPEMEKTTRTLFENFLQIAEYR